MGGEESVVVKRRENKQSLVEIDFACLVSRGSRRYSPRWRIDRMPYCRSVLLSSLLSRGRPAMPGKFPEWAEELRSAGPNGRLSSRT